MAVRVTQTVATALITEKNERFFFFFQIRKAKSKKKSKKKSKFARLSTILYELKTKIKK